MRFNRKKLATLMILCMLVNLMAGIPAAFAMPIGVVITADKTTLENGVSNQEVIVTAPAGVDFMPDFGTNSTASYYSFDMRDGGNDYQYQITRLDANRIKIVFSKGPKAGNFTFEVRGNGGSSQGGFVGGKPSNKLVFNVPTNNSDINLGDTNLPNACSGMEYKYMLPISGGNGSKTVVTTGAAVMPNGLFLTADGNVSGIATQAGNYTIKVAVSDQGEGDQKKTIVGDYTLVVEDKKSNGDWIYTKGYLVAYKGSSLTPIIPSSIQGIPTPTIYDNAFLWINGNNSRIISATLSEGIQKIGNSAFSDCRNLETVEIPASLTEIDRFGFNNCSNLKQVFFKGNSPVKLGINVFKNNGNGTATLLSDLKIYYSKSATGFDAPMWNEYRSQMVSYDPAIKYEIRYHGNADSGTAPENMTGLGAGETRTVSGEGSLKKAGYVFASWNTAADGSGKTYIPGQSIQVVQENIELYAQWNKISAIVKDTKIANGTIRVMSYSDYVKQFMIEDEDAMKRMAVAEAVSDEAMEVPMPMPMPMPMPTPAPVPSPVPSHEKKPIKDKEPIKEIIEAAYGEKLIVEAIPNAGYELKIGSVTLNGESMKLFGERSRDVIMSSNMNVYTADMPGTTATITAQFDKITSDYQIMNLEKDMNFIVKYYGNASHLNLPEVIDGKKINGVYSNILMNNQSVEHVLIPESYLGLGPNALGSAPNLKSAFFKGNLPDKLGPFLFGKIVPDFKVYYVNGKTGFDSPAIGMYNKVAVTPAEIVAKDKALLEWATINGANTDQLAVTQNLKLQSSGKFFAAPITWTSSNPQVISNTGEVKRPTNADAVVQLTATLAFENVTETKVFDVKVTKQTATPNGGKEPVEKPEKQPSNNTSSPSSSAPSAAVQPQLPVAPVQPEVPKNTAKEKENQPNKMAVAQTVVEAKANAAGKLEAKVTEVQMKEAFKKALEEAAKLEKGALKAIEISVSAGSDAKQIETSLTKASLTEMSGSQMNALTVSTPLAKLTFDEKTLGTISKEATGDVKVSVTKVETKDPSAIFKQLIGDRAIYDFAVTSVDKKISQFGGSVAVSLPYSPKANENTKALVVYYIDEKGNFTPVPSGRYNSSTGKVEFTVKHFSQYAVGYNMTEFKDVSSQATYKDAVTFVAARGIANGVSADQFKPEGKLKRGDFLMMLMKAYGIQADEKPSANFADAGKTYYTNYLSAAKRLGLTNGIGGNKFAPEKELTQKEMAIFAANTLKVLGEQTDASDSTMLATLQSSQKTAVRADMAQLIYSLLAN